MYIEGIATSMIRDVQPSKNSASVSAAGGQTFIESINDVALRSQMVVRGNQLSSAGLHERKMVNDWNTKIEEEQEDLFEGIFSKIDRIEEIIKEKFNK